jgi:hypothetical protein
VNHFAGIEQHKKCGFNPRDLKVLAKKGATQLKLEDHKELMPDSILQEK